MTTAPVFVAATEALAGARVLLDGAEGHHAAAVRRVQIGEQVNLVDGFGVRARGTVVAVGRRTIEVDLVDRSLEPVPQPRVVVVQALAKGDRGERAVAALTEVGSDEIVPWAAARSVTQWRDDRGVRALERWRVLSREAAKQSRRARFPVVAELATTSDVCRLLTTASLGLVLHESADVGLASYGLPATGHVVLVVGPEGGISLEELAAFAAAGAIAARLGPTVLRTSTAGVIAAALVLARTRWLA